MSKRVHQVVVRSLAQSLAHRGAHAAIYDALHAAMPKYAEQHLSLFCGDKQTAGEFLMSDIGSHGYQTLLDRYVSGDASGALAQTVLACRRVTGAIQNARHLQSLQKSESSVETRSEDENS